VLRGMRSERGNPHKSNAATLGSEPELDTEHWTLHHRDQARGVREGYSP